MCEVVKSNFKELYPQIERSLKKAAFIAIDCEFSGLVSHARLKNSLFDTASERYLKLKRSIEQFTVFQCGLAVFHYHRDENKYVADVFDFYTFPGSFGPVENCFLCQPTSWEFLVDHNFKFDKVAYDGIPFLNNVQEEVIRQTLSQGTMMSNVERALPFRHEDALQEACSRVAEWLPRAQMGDTMEACVTETDYRLIYFMHTEIRNRFEDVWTSSVPEKVVVKKLSESERAAALSAEGDVVDRQLIDSLVGFGKVFHLLSALKKPLIGHNMLLDLMILYNQMYRPLPNTYAKFKKELNILFPSIHDTKYISYRVRDLLKKQDYWSSNRLDVLYTFLHAGRGRGLAMYSPTIEVRANGDGEQGSVEHVEEHVHEAAWDAYMSGYCFIRLAHYMAIRRLGEDALPRPLSRVEHLSAMSQFCNRINIIRASVSHMNIGGEEPVSHTKLLYVTRLDNQPVNIEQLTAKMAACCLGSVDVRTHSKRSALVAVPNKYSARDIVRKFHNDPSVKVVPYSYLIHGCYLPAVLWSGVVLASAVCAGAVITTFWLKK